MSIETVNIAMDDPEQRWIHETLGEDQAEFCECKSWQEWFPGTKPSLESFMGWLEIYLQTKPEFQAAEAIEARKHNTQAVVVWIWMNLEHLPDDVVQNEIMLAAEDFEQSIGWCCVFHPEVYLKYIRELERKLTRRLQDLATPIAVAKFVASRSVTGTGFSQPFFSFPGT